MAQSKEMLQASKVQQNSDGYEFSNIITPDQIKMDLFSKACDDKDYSNLIQFILSFQKILKLYQKPGRKNPFLSMQNEGNLQIIKRLSHLANRIKFTKYQIILKKIINKIQLINPVLKSLRIKNQPDEGKKITNVNLQQILNNPQMLNCIFSCPYNLYEYAINEILPQAGRQILSINDHAKRYELVLKSLQFCGRLIHPTEIQIQISKNTLIQSRDFKMFYQFYFQSSQVNFLIKAYNIINQALLCPSDQKIQWALLKLLKRMYKLWGQLVHGPIYLNLRNISLFFSQESARSKVIKQASIFCYFIISAKSDLKLSDMLSSSEDLQAIKRNQFYSSKGLALPFELGNIYDSTKLELPIWKYHLHLDKRETYVYNVIIEKPNTLLFWHFQLPAHDVGFAVYKVVEMRKYQLEEYEKNGQVSKPIVKYLKYGAGTANSKMPIRGQIFLKTGLYHLVFDNSYSIMRSKDVYFQICLLQSSL